MRQRPSFQATSWESLEGRQLLATVQFPDLGALYAQFNQKNTPPPPPPGTNPQPQILVLPSSTPAGYLDSRVKLTKSTVDKLDAAADSFAVDYTYGQDSTKDSAAVAKFKASLDAIDSAISAEQKLPKGTTSSLINPLLNGVPLTRSEVNTLEYTLDTFQQNETYTRDNVANNAAALNALESGMNLLIANHPKPAPAK